MQIHAWRFSDHSYSVIKKKNIAVNLARENVAA